MTVAAFLLECEMCHDKVGLLWGSVEKFMCYSCVSEKAYPSPPPSTSDASHPPRAGTTSPVPTAGALYFDCPSCGHKKEWRLEKKPWPGAVCIDCFRASHPRTGGSTGG